MDYRVEIIKLVESISSDWKLQYLYTFIKQFVDKTL